MTSNKINKVHINEEPDKDNSSFLLNERNSMNYG